MTRYSIQPAQWLQVNIVMAGMLCLFLLGSCVRQENIQGPGDSRMQGIWNQDSIPYREQLNSFTEHRLKFTCDSFYVDLTTHSKVNYYEEACFNKGVWQEYAKGNYAVRGDTLFLAGTFTKSNYKQKVSGCYRTGRYMENFLIKKATSTLLVLESLSDHRESSLALKQKITCVPKPL
ncbi:fumarate hydratase [Pedobacter sp. SYP-B3415]|uniref:fumarate hydratase n=1 Tax=Pedobacter sp. SYP-B3415 TaxID=2496641 RepID=UPI001F1146B8|nr:fumarate hydratase [Pedobacter sp. SYP-B3415]